jgi:hypothetical protein
LAGERGPALQKVGNLRIGDKRGQVIRPQGEVAARQFVGIVHCRDYRARRRRSPSLRRARHAIDDENARNRCIVARQHFRWGGTPGA